MSTTLRPASDDYAAIYDPDRDFDRHYTAATADLIAGRLGPGQRVLELGCATGAMTARLTGEGRTVVAVDRAPAYLRRAHARGLHGVSWVRGDLEQPLPAGLGGFDHVVLANVLHELDDPEALLRRVVREHLAPDGTVHVSLQNPRSLHRLVALEMGLIGALDEVAETGRRYATRRLYDAADVAALAARAGLAVTARDGVLLKPLPNAAMAELSPEVLAGFVAAARHLPDHAAMGLYVLRAARRQPTRAPRADGRPADVSRTGRRDALRAADAVIVGGSLAALVAADALGAEGRPARLLLPARGVGGGFAPIRRDGRVLELGVRLLELDFEGTGAAPPLMDYRPGVGAHRPWAATVDRWVRGLLGEALRPARAPQMLLDGRRVPDLLFSVDLTGMDTTLPDGLRRAMLEQVRAARAALGDDAGLLAPRHAERLAAATLHDASIAQHGAAFHDRYVAPLVDKVLDGGASAVAATLRRKAWAPMFHPATLEQALAGGPIDFRPSRPMHAVDPRSDGLVERLLARIATHRTVRVATVGDLVRIDPSGGDGTLLTFADGPPLVALRPLVACGAEALFAAAGVAYGPPRVRTAVAWLEVDADAVRDVPDLLHDLDPGSPLLRVSRGGAAAAADRALLTVELRHDVPEHALAATAEDVLRGAGLVPADAALHPVAAVARRTFAVPSPELQATHAAASRELGARGLHLDLAAGALSPVADTLNDQVVQGLRAAGRTP